MRVLVTGGAGFIGSHIADTLLARGDDVLVLDDLASGRAERLDSQVPLYRVSITDAAALNHEVATFSPELICHLAAQIDVRASVDAPAADAGVNILGTVNLLEAARQAGARGAVRIHRRRPGTGATRPSRRWRTCCRCPSRRPGSRSTAPSATSACTTGCTAPGTRYCGWPTCTGRGRTRRGRPGSSPSSVPACWPAGNRSFTATAPRRATTCTWATRSARSSQLATAAARAPGNIGTGLEVSVLDLVVIIGVVAGRGVRPSFAGPRPGELQRSAVATERAASELGWV